MDSMVSGFITGHSNIHQKEWLKVFANCGTYSNDQNVGSYARLGSKMLNR